MHVQNPRSLTLEGPTSQNDHTHLSNLSATVDKLFECAWPFCGIDALRVNHCIRQTSDEFQYNAAIHVEINDILWSKSQNNSKELHDNMIDIAMTCRSYNMGKIFISLIILSHRTFINKKSKNDTLKQLWQGNNFAFIDNFQAIKSHGKMAYI